jgi:hypothetical protein
VSASPVIAATAAHMWQHQLISLLKLLPCGALAVVDFTPAVMLSQLLLSGSSRHVAHKAVPDRTASRKTALYRT